jgi:hypothetical protein
LEEINNNDKYIAKLTKRRKDMSGINKIRDEKGDVTTKTNEI